MTTTNIKNLPKGKYVTEYGYSDCHAWKVLKRTARTMTIAEVEVELDPEWKEKMKVYAGGFAGHCANQREQTWLFKRVNMENTRTIHLSKKHHQWMLKGTLYKRGFATEFYDYNF